MLNFGLAVHGTAKVFCLVFCSAMKIRFSESVRVYKTESENYFFTVRHTTILFLSLHESPAP